MVVMPKQNVPALRLEGFSGEWELKAIGELFAERNESFPEGELLSVTLRNGIKRFQEIGRHNTSNEDKSKYKLVEVGDIAYNSMRMWQGASGVSPWKGIVSPAYTVLKPVGSQDTPFFAYYFKTPFMIQVFQLNSQGLTSDTWNLKYPALSAIDICRPQDIEEQQAIGAIFTNLDAVINQHTLKHKALQQAKTALMQRMFPQEGQTVPELRLEGFSGEWGTVSLDELQKRRLVTLGRGEVISQIDINAHPGNYPIYSSSAKNDGLFGRYGRYMFSDERITWSIDGGGQFFYRPAHRYSVTNVCGWMKINTNTIDTSFLYLALYLQWLEQSFDYSAKAHPSNIVQIYNPHFPPTLEEQQAIGAVFTNLDQLIAAEAQYIASLKQAKTALLQRMFI